MCQPCLKARHVGEGCGMKLIWSSEEVHRKCRTYLKIEVKQRRVCCLEGTIQRWKSEARRGASIERAEKDISDLYDQIIELEMSRPIRKNSLR